MFIYKRCRCETAKLKALPPKETLSALTKYLKLASVPSRLALLFLLHQKPHCVCDLMAHTKMSQTLISHHLADLTKASLIESQKKGKFVDYSLTKKGKMFMSQLTKTGLAHWPSSRHFPRIGRRRSGSTSRPTAGK